MTCVDTYAVVGERWGEDVSNFRNQRPSLHLSPTTGEREPESRFE